MRRVFHRLILLWCLCLPVAGWAQRVAFVNPGKTDEAYWVAVSQAMQAAADSLGMTLQVHYTGRQHLRAFEIARSLVALPAAQRPEYVVFSNDYGTGPEMLRIFEGSGIRSFMAFSKPTEQERQLTGGPRERYADWIGTLEPRAQEAGYLTAKALIAKGRAMRAHGPDGKLHLIALAGDRSTTTSIRRNEGMRRAVAEAPDVVLQQEVYAAWSREKAEEQAQWLYDRYPHARLVWAGSDQMAFGAMQALRARGGEPGRTVWFSAINTSREAMEALQSGRLAVLAGGHFINGAWALVMIHDYHRGKDFAREGLELESSMFTLFTPALAGVYLQRLGERFEHAQGRVDFRRYSKVHNPQLRRYEFGFAQLLR